MRVLGLTGSIAMGKSTAARLLRRMRVPVYDADAEIHTLLAAGGAGVAPVAAAFPGTVVRGAVDRAALGARVFADPAALRRLEQILHPLARAAQRAFLDRHMRARTRLVCLDVPLLFETMGERRCDLVVVVSASATIQHQRAMARPGMTAEKLAGILARQMPDSKKRILADVVAITALGHLPTLRALAKAARLARTIPRRRKD
ncbi:MAG: dephospho-CoA kinase [Rhodospirillales bacterium]|nr:dephospho-CoA kinase [Rhodospirillales bacterium]